MYYFKLTFQNGTSIYHDKLTKRQAVLRYNKWKRDWTILMPIKEVAWGLM